MMRKPEARDIAPRASYAAQLARCYRFVGLMVFNTLLLIGLFLVGLDVCLRYAMPLGAMHVYSRAFNPDSYVSGPSAIESIGHDFDRMGDQESFAYNPWTTFSADVYDGEFVNVVMAGYPARATLPADSAYDGRPTLAVWTFGGSTMFGWGVADEQTVASHLQRALQRKFPSRQVRVTNYGQPYFFSS